MTLLDHQFLRLSHPKHAGPYLHKISIEGEANTDAISHELLSAVTNQALPPRVYELWLCACRDETAIVLGLHQSKSVLVRRGAIKAFRRWFRTSRCVDIWRAVGGTEGIVQMLARMSVNHVREFSKQLGQCRSSMALSEERQKLVSELMYSLASRFFPESAKIQNPDERPLWKGYAELVYACTPEARDAWTDEKALPELDLVKLMQTNTEHYQQQCLKKAVAGDKNLQRYSALLVSLPAKMSAVDPTVSQPMEFAALFLETLDEHGVKLVKGAGERELGSAFATIIRRLARRNISEDFAIEMVGLIARCAKQHVVEEASGYSSNYGEYLTDIARIWQRNPATFEAPLSELLKESDRINLQQLVATISVVPTGIRYRLLRWLVITQHSIDLDNADQLSRFRFPIPWNLFVTLPKPEARDFVDRIVSIKEDAGHWLNGIMPYLVTINQELLHCQLIDDDASRLREATAKTSQYQRSAEKERDADSRMERVTAAGHMAIVSKSLDLLKDMLLWARRYNRDPLVTQLYANGTLLSREDTLSLLSGIPERPDAASKSNLMTNVRKGNEIVLLLLDTAAMCQNEPSFYATHWSMVQHLFADIVQVRIQRIRQLRSRLGLSEDEANDLVWKPTLEALLQAEQLGIDERNQALQFNDINGPLDIWGDVEIEDPDPSVLWFMNELAVRRDALWQRHRCNVHASVMTLEAWPRGLPVQALLSVYIKGKVTAEGVPFVMKRAKSVIFMSREDAFRAIPEGKEDRAAIGCFVDDYSLALKIYISGCDKQEQQRRSNAAWEYATTQLSDTRLSPREAVIYWQKVFYDADAPFTAHVPDLRLSPTLPELDIDDDKPEWNPDSGPHPSIKDQELDPISLDCFTSSTGGKTIHDAFTLPRPSISQSQTPGFWDLNRSRFSSGIPFDAKDAFIAAGLLLVDALSQADSKILSKTFPQGSQRFPAVFLDSEFVEAQRSFSEFPPELLSDTPPALLEQLTAALIAKLSASTSPPRVLVQWAFKTLKLLAWSDDPGLAIRHIVHVVINLPEHSSWHRVLLHPGVLKRLSTEQSKALVSALAEAINENSRQRKLANAAVQSASAGPDGDTKATSTAIVKVTTVKLLAQLMSRAQFIEEGFTVEVLVRMFTEATHIDIRAAIVDSLLAITASTNTPLIEENIMTMLETHVVPFAAELSERSPMTEQSWAECEANCKPPDIEMQKPARDALLAFVERSKWNRDEPKTRELVQRLLLPLVRKAATNGQLWLKIFLRANDALDLYPSIPEAFGAYDLLKHMVERYPAHMPAAYFNDLHELLIFFAEASQEYQALRDCFKAMDPSPVAHDAYQELCEYASSQVDGPNSTELLKTAIFATAEDAAAHDLLTPTQLQAHERAMIDIRLAQFGQDAKHWESLVRCYSPPLRQKGSTQLAWYSYCKPLVEYMVERIDATRTTAWQHDPQRQPARLPDAFSQRLWLLTYPSRPWRADAEQEQRRDQFVKELRDLVEQLGRSGRPYQARFNLLVAAAKQCYEKDWAFIAWQMGALQDEQTGRDLTLVELLQVELADRLLQGAKQPVAEQVMAGVKNMLADWRRCLDENARDRGFVTTAMLKSNAKNKDALPME